MRPPRRFSSGRYMLAQLYRKGWRIGNLLEPVPDMPATATAEALLTATAEAQATAQG